ncbi:putative E3 ubiquitin-protein ligase UNKL isoform X3 [Narcine bancroftii]|uniref:putative E3 ubiquitin-protein ligase UNKL isoform X3 n=1 Tax=Narcine bancroftii TaxID=1343680 RepID=UPI003831918D
MKAIQNIRERKEEITESCPYLHRTTGDTERKYHLRYYKTGTCIHETDARGHCVKNGLHCAFAHGPHDLRPPVYDIRELQAQEALQNGQLGAGEGLPDLQPGVLASQAMIEKTLSEDPRWQETNFVLANYKTDQCNKPPRLCRQGYACPHYHNSRDRRRNPRKFKYRSTPCPNVKHGDEWGEPTKCESGDNCQYCHSRTEQQFHPEIYKSTKCNDMRQTGYCPRGPFCAFAHVERIPSSEEVQIMNQVASMMQAGAVAIAQPKQGPRLYSTESLGTTNEWSTSINPASNNGQIGNASSSSSPTVTSSSDAATSSVSSPTSTYPKAPGFEREDQAKQHKNQTLENSQKLNEHDSKQNLLNVFSVVNPLASSITSSLASSIGSDTSSPSTLSTMNAKAVPFYPASNTVESVIGSALDLHFGDVNVASLDKELEDQDTGDIGLKGQRLLGSSAPVNIPGSLARSSSLHSSSSLSASPLGSLSQSFLSSTMAPQQQSQQQSKSDHTLLSTSASSHSSLGLNGVSGSIWDHFVSGNFSPSPSPVFSSSATTTTAGSSNNELTRVRRELEEAKRKIKQWEDSWQQVKQACDAWQKEAQEAKERAKVADTDRQIVTQQKEEVDKQLKKLQDDFDALCRSPNFPLLRNYGDIDKLPLPKLHSIQSQLRADLDLVDGVIYQLQSKKCIVCQERDRSILLQPCQHYVLCEHCAPNKIECPYCKTKVMNW